MDTLHTEEKLNTYINQIIQTANVMTENVVNDESFLEFILRGADPYDPYLPPHVEANLFTSLQYVKNQVNNILLWANQVLELERTAITKAERAELAQITHRIEYEVKNQQRTYHVHKMTLYFSNNRMVSNGIMVNQIRKILDNMKHLITDD